MGKTLGYTRITVPGRVGDAPAVIKVGGKNLEDILEGEQADVSKKADKSYVDNKLDTKANAITVAGKTDLSVIAPSFSKTSTYEEGAFVIQGGKLYECTTAVETAGDFNSTDWTERTVAYLITQLRPTE